MSQNEVALIKETFKAGDYIFFEGEVDYHFYIIESGSVGISTKGPDGSRIEIATVESGESFGEFALLERSPRSASAQALTDCVLIKVSEAGYQQLLAELPLWASSMLRSFAVRLMKMNEVLKKSQQFLSRDELTKSNVTDFQYDPFAGKFDPE